MSESLKCVIRILAVLAAGTGTVSCDMGEPQAASVHDQMTVRANPSTDMGGATATTQPAVSRSAVRAVALVNGEPVDRKELIDLLIQTHGLPLLQQLFLRDVAVQEGRRRGINLSPQDIEQEYDYSLQADHLDGKDVEKLTAARREQMIDDWTRVRGVSREELRIAMERQAWLRKIIGEVKVEAEDLKKEYERDHGEKVEVRHLQIAAPRFFGPIKARLDKGESFEALVREASQNSLSRDRGGLLPPFSRIDETVPEVFIKTAFALEVGQYSLPVEAQGSYHVLKLERRITPDGTPFETVREVLRRHLTARRTMTAIQETGARLLMQAELRIEEPVLREEYRKAQSSGQISGPILAGQ